MSVANTPPTRFEGPDSAFEPIFKNMIHFSEGDDQGPQLIGLKCANCGQHSIGLQQLCPNCYSADLDQALLSRRGTLYSFSITQLPPFGFAAPLAVGLVDLPEGLRIWAQLQADDLDDLKIGMELEMTVGPLRVDGKGRNIIGYLFRPVAE